MRFDLDSFPSIRTLSGTVLQIAGAPPPPVQPPAITPPAPDLVIRMPAPDTTRGVTDTTAFDRARDFRSVTDRPGFTFTAPEDSRGLSSRSALGSGRGAVGVVLPADQLSSTTGVGGGIGGSAEDRFWMWLLTVGEEAWLRLDLLSPTEPPPDDTKSEIDRKPPPGPDGPMPPDSSSGPAKPPEQLPAPQAAPARKEPPPDDDAGVDDADLVWTVQPAIPVVVADQGFGQPWVLAAALLGLGYWWTPARRDRKRARD
jgi:hypothetical protein